MKLEAETKKEPKAHSSHNKMSTCHNTRAHARIQTRACTDTHSQVVPYSVRLDGGELVYVHQDSHLLCRLLDFQPAGLGLRFHHKEL